MFPKDRPVTCITANGAVEVTHMVKMQILASGAGFELEVDVMLECDFPLLSLGGLCMHRGFSFYWSNGQPHLVTPKGKHVWLDNLSGTVPELTSETLVINKINELEAYAKIDAAEPQRSEDGKSTPNLDIKPNTNSTTTQVDRPFYLEIFAGSGR